MMSSPTPLPRARADRRRHRHVAFLELDRVAEHEDVGLRSLVFWSSTTTLSSRVRPVGRDLRRIDLRELAQALAELTESRLNELLPLERGLVLAVLAQVAELHRLPNFLRKRDVQLVLQLFDFFAELLLQLFDHRCPAETASNGQKSGAPGL